MNRVSALRDPPSAEVNIGKLRLVVNARREGKPEADVPKKVRCVVREGCAAGTDKSGSLSLCLYLSVSVCLSLSLKIVSRLML